MSANETPAESTETVHLAPEKEHQFHTYTSTAIPWSVRLMWMLFWIFAVYYTIRYLFPDLQIELLNPL